MINPPITPLVPFSQASADTIAAFLRGLKTQRSLDSNPAAWHCLSCGENTAGNDVLISYDVGDTPIPYCPADGCSGYGPDLVPAER